MSTTGMRWGDSDSSDEEEIRVSSLPLPGARRDVDSPPPRQRSPPARSSGPPARQSGGQARSSGRDRPKSTNDRDHRHDGGRHRQKEQNWREMAKSSSRFAGNENAPAPPLDGSAWMAQRRKKLEEESEKERMDMEQRKREEEEEKRTRRKSQFDALKAAVKVIEATSSLQAAAAQTKPEPQQRAPPAPTRILTRPIDPKPKDPKATRKNDDGKEHDQKPTSSSEPKLLHDERPASPDHVADSRSVQSSSTSGSTRRKEGRGGRGRRAGGGRGRNAERAKSASTLEGGAHHGRGGGRDARGGGGRGRNLDRAKSTDSTTVSSLEGSSPSRDAHGRGGGRDAHGRSSGRRGGGGRNRDHGGRRDHGGKQSGRGRGGSGPVQVGSSQVVRTASGNIECQVSLDHEEKKTKGELMPNGTVRLSRKKKGGQGKHTLLNTKLEIGKTEK